MIPVKDLIYRFRVELVEIEPSIWRLIEVPAKYSFWDLHVAIQDAMGWLDYHLHEFSLEGSSETLAVRIGIPNELIEEDVRFEAGWTVPISRHFVNPGDSAIYDYDFGDDWSHEVRLVATQVKEAGVKYPRCVAGERACPPEDCGGLPGYQHLLEVLANPRHEERRDMIQWLKGHAKNYHPYRPDHFDPHKVRFFNPKRRFEMMMDTNPP